MPRTRKSIKWTVTVDDQVVTGIRSKTYSGACFKAFKKLGLKPRTATRKVVSDYVNPKKIQYDDTFPGTYCVAE